MVTKPIAFLSSNAIRQFKAGVDLPQISTRLDSIRAYQFEVHFDGLPIAFTPGESRITLAAKQVSPIGAMTEEIVVDRLNDKIFYPGKFNPEEITITFDNLLLESTSTALWNWFQTTHNSLTGRANPNPKPGVKSNKCHVMRIVEMDTGATPVASIELYGVFPKSVRFSEKNYSTNEFSTLEVTFRFDFVDYGRYGIVDPQAGTSI